MFLIHHLGARHTSPDTLERGKFSARVRVFTVRASSTFAPDSFQVFADGNRSDVVLVVSGLNSGDLRATWGDSWRTASEEWREWLKDQAFMAFYNGKAVGRVRVCNG